MTTTARAPLTQKDRILDLLRRREFVTNAELNEVAFRYSARIHELRAEGHDIRWAAVKGRPGLTRYRLEKLGRGRVPPCVQ